MIGIPSSATVVALVLGAVALAIVPERPRVRPGWDTAAAYPATAGRHSARRAVLGAAGVAASGLMLAPALWWVVVPSAVLTWIMLSRRPIGRSAGQRANDRKLVAVFAELFAACLDAGMAVGPALRAVADVLGDAQSTTDESAGGRGAGLSTPPRRGAVAADGPVTARGRPGADPPGGRPPARTTNDARGPVATLEAVAAMLSLGASPLTAWRPAELDENLAPLAAAARRSAVGGSALAQAVREHAAHLRAETAAASVRAAGRAGVMMTAPLGICFLPAFLCLGLAPVVVGLLGQLEIF